MCLVDLFFKSEFGINCNFIQIIVDLAGYYSKGQTYHLAHYCFNPLLSPQDASTHYFTSLKTDLILLQLGVLE